jgi:hypothetical protein
MSTVQAELTAVNALRDYLLRALPAKVASINTGRTAFLRAPYAGPYTIPSGGSLKLGIVPGSEATQTLTAGSRTTAQVVSELSATGITASADAQDRLLLTATAVPVVDTPSFVSLGEDSTGTNQVFGWGPGGDDAIREALVAPGMDGVMDGDNRLLDTRRGFGVMIGERKSQATRNNIRYDETDVTMKVSVLVPVPGGSQDSYQEHVGQCVRAVRECIYEDRTLDARVQLCTVENVTIMGPTYALEEAGVSMLLSRADLLVRCRVFERS